MAVESQPFVSALGHSCTVYVESDNAELYAPHLERLIVAGGGTVTRNPDSAAAVVVIKRGAEKIESRIIQMWNLRHIDPWIQGVVDVDWVNDCIKKAELQGPPEWGGYLLEPQKTAISKREARDAVCAVFGPRPTQAERPNISNTAIENPDQVGAATRSPLRRNPPTSREERSKDNDAPERGRSGLSSDDAWNKVKDIVKELDPKKLRHYTHGDLLDLILYLAREEADSQSDLWEAFAQKKASQSVEPSIKLFTNSADEVLLNEKLPPTWKEMCPILIRERTAANPTRALRDEPGVWTRWARRHWDIIAAGAIALKAKPYIRATGAVHPVQAQLSTAAGSHTPADFDEMADFIAKQIKFRRVSEREEKEAMGQDFVWKAFAIVYNTNRSWKEWQRYYNQKADNINRAARLRLKPRSQSGSLPADSLLPQVEAQMALLPSSSGYPSPPVSRPLKRALEGAMDGTRPKHIRPN
ncbi:hypothetical protein FRC01_001376 [Tulasnella sp. 417]|nr:hypothetical protein FRC01_001376 [Tulasnella sp. 417]